MEIVTLLPVHRAVYRPPVRPLSSQRRAQRTRPWHISVVNELFVQLFYERYLGVEVGFI